MLHFDMSLYYVYLESRIFMSFFVFSLLYVVFILSMYVCYSCYYNNFVTIFTIGYHFVFDITILVLFNQFMAK